MSDTQFSNYIIYVDESGDHSLTRIDPNYPCFVLSFCIFQKEEYISRVVPSVQRLKFKWWGHDTVILHTIDIKRELKDFRFLTHLPTKVTFMADLNALIQEAPFTLVAAVIDKEKLVDRSSSPDNPYYIALKYCMEMAYSYLKDLGQHEAQTTIVVEERGTKEDRDLEMQFHCLCYEASIMGEYSNFNLRICSKKANASGLQFADLVSTPIGRKFLNSDQHNRGYEIIERHFRRSPTGTIAEWGYKVFP